MFDFIGDISITWTVVILLAVSYTVNCIRSAAFDSSEIKAPFGSTYLKFTPRWIANSIYAWDAIGVIERGYQNFRASAYKLLRSDVNMIILPASTIPELSSLPIEVASGIQALERDLLGKWTGLNMIIESRLHHRLVQRKLTPNLSLVTPGVEEEVRNAILEGFGSNTDEWVEIKPYYILLKVSARVSSRVLVGFPICQDERWLDIAMNFTEDIFESIVLMRCFPPWLYSTLGYLLPSVWRTKSHIRKAQQLLGPAFAKRLKELDDGTYVPTPGQEPDGFSWLAEIAEGHERNPTKLAHYEILLALASIHTTLLREVNVLYDVMAEPSLLEVVRQEIADVSKTGWSKSSYAELHKLDSIMRESQRISPPTSIGLRRIMQQPYTLADGTHLPKGSYICVPSYTIENDPANTSEPEKFDGLRAYKLHQNDPTSHHHFTSTEPSVLGFGHGKTACPGRFFASLALKAVFAKLLTEYDFKFMPGTKERPPNFFAHEFVFPNRSNTILVRKRAGNFAPF